jgi:hypothetical protein
MVSSSFPARAGLPDADTANQFARLKSKVFRSVGKSALDLPPPNA